MNKLQYSFESDDICTLSIECHTSEKNQTILHIHNVYNELDMNLSLILSKLTELLNNRDWFQYSDDEIFIEHLIVRDLNVHHLQWDDRHISADSRLAALLDLINEFQLKQQLKPDTIMYQCRESKESTLNLIFTTKNLTNRLIKCQVWKNLDHDSDHYLIETLLKILMFEVSEKKTHNWKRTNDILLRDTLTVNLSALKKMLSSHKIEDFTTHIIKAIAGVIETFTLLTQVSSEWSHTGFNAQCKETCLNICRKKRIHDCLLKKHNENRDHLKIQDAREKWQSSQNRKNWTVKKTLQKIHWEKMKQSMSDSQKTWKLIKWANNCIISFKSFISTLEKLNSSMTLTIEKKVKILAEIFFSQFSEADLSDIEEYVYLKSIQLLSLQSIEIQQTIMNAVSNKKSGSDSISNQIFRNFLSVLLFSLQCLFNVCWDISYHLKHFWNSTTVVLRKPEKENYTKSKAYWSIALLSTIKKTLEFIMITQISWLTETYQLLLCSHIRECREIFSEHTVHTLIKKIHVMWADNETVSLLLLNISEAFDNVSHPQLIHNLRKRRLCNSIVKWVVSFIKDRITFLTLPEQITDQITVSTDISQRFFISLILYLYYNADLLEIETDLKLSFYVTDYIDDIAILILSRSVNENNCTLQKLHSKIMIWEHKHTSVFTLNKYQLIHFEKKWLIGTSDSLILKEHNVSSADNGKYLEIILNSQLTWDSHISYLEMKAEKRLSVLSALSESMWGINLKDLWWIYIVTVLSQFLYCMSV